MAPTPDSARVPAGFRARYVAWSLDAAIIGSLSLLATWRGMIAAMAALQLAWSQLQQIASARLSDVLLHGVMQQEIDPTRLAAQLVQDPALRTAATAVETALNTLLMPPLWVFVGLAAVYWIGFERSAWQATPGKRALRLQVTDGAGRRPGLARAAARHFAGALSWLTLNLGHLLAAVPPQKRALHDYIADARVLRDGDAADALPGWARAWLALQIAVGIGLLAWLLQRYVAALQAVMLQPA